ncbi:hypothetical protein JGH11_02425 [Dysgonomonas sp. Marseille-P4677]|uniref:hypothetical protein n=1 Tax=Dysgonomonas sp. Marseille-P4677 TaxID=2364790 RepID=UPI001912D14C|nr:hypothetical protein [Dysgonomonas sp. Marseille-P4677]MBK5719722.1 hypothetical protein [Dysgonomonas sp. Marseille-P4677]
MKRILLIISFLILTTLMSYSQNLSIDGTWTLEKIEVTITTDGQDSKKTYTKKDQFKTPTICVEKLEFAPENNLSVLFRGWDKAESGSYIISGNTLTWNHPTAAYKFHIQYNNGVLEMLREGEYAIDGKISQYKYVHYLTKTR